MAGKGAGVKRSAGDNASMNSDAFLQLPALRGPVGLIEFSTALPASAPRALAVLCHPHSLFGGSMSNKVVTTMERAFRDLGLATLRFNFRGVGKSEGVFDHGLGEGEDLAAACVHAQRALPNLPLWLAGFSFGSYVAARMAKTLGAAQLLSIAPPVVSWDFTALQRGPAPWLIVQGEQDEVVDPEAVYRFADGLHPAATLVRMPGSHFFHGKLVDLRDLLTAHYQNL